MILNFFQATHGEEIWNFLDANTVAHKIVSFPTIKEVSQTVAFCFGDILE